MHTKFKYIQDWTIIGLFLIPPLVIGYWAGKNEIIRKPWVVTVDIVEEDDEIQVIDHYSGDLIYSCDASQKSKETRLLREIIKK